MKAKSLLSILFSICLLSSNAQVELKMKKKEIIQQKIEKKSDKAKIGHGERGATIIEKIQDIKADRIELYRQVVKRYGRWEGYGKPITLEYASHLPYYYKLTYTGSSKYPTRMQAFNGYHKLTTNHTIGTYLIKPDSENEDTEADSTWIEKINSVVQWDFIYNEKGDICIERAFDANGELVYAYYPVKIGNRIAGTYTDAWGMPAKLRKSGGAQVVYVTYDNNGFVCLQEFYDEYGYRQKNNDGAYMTRIKNRSDGMVLTKASCNIAGKRMIDIFGNCGMQAEYDKDGKQLFDINMDENWEPIRVTHGKDPFYYNMIKRKYEYDDYDRPIRISFVDLDNKADTNSIGVHSIEITYNDRGFRTSVSYYDLNGNLRTNPYNGVSKWENEFDEDGRVIRTRNYGDSAILSKEVFHEMFWTYDKNGDEISHLYIDFNGDTVSGNTFIRTPNGLKKLTNKDIRPKDFIEIRRFTNSNRIERIEYDSQGRQTLREFRDLEGNAIAPFGYHKNISQYEAYDDSIRTITDFYTDSLDTVIQLEDNDWGIRKEVLHLKKGIVQTSDVYLYRADSTFHKAWRNVYDSVGHKISEASLNKYGSVSRLGADLYHHCSVEYDIKGNDLSSIVGYNEFEEPAYIENGKGVSHYWNFINGDLTYYDENGNPITDMEAFKDSLPAVMSISIIDSVAYNLGLQDGDIILKYGDWCTGLNMQKQDTYNMFYFKLIEFANQEKEVIILRHIPTENKSIILTIPLPVGTIQDLGIFPQLIYYTSREKQRHEDAVNGFIAKNGLLLLGENKKSEGTHTIIIRKPNRINGYIPTFGKTISYLYNPAIVLSMAKYVNINGSIIANKYWNLGMGLDTLDNILTSQDIQAFYISESTDLQNTYDGFPYYSMAHEWGMLNINDVQFARIQEVNADFIRRRGDSFNPAYRRKGTDTSKKETKKKLTPNVFFQSVKNYPEVVYAPHALTVINSDSLYLPNCFNDLEMLFIGKVQSHEVYNRVKDDMAKIDTTGYVKLPYFHSEDLALVKVIGQNLYSEVFLVYFANHGVQIFSQKGLFSLDELMAIQKTFGMKNAKSLFNKNDTVSQIPLIVAITEQDGLARQSDIEGEYVILEYNDWNMSMGIKNIGETIESGKENEKRLVLMKIHWKDDSSFGYFDTPQVYYFNKGVLGMRILDWGIKQSLYDRAASAYEKYKRMNNKRNK